MVTIERSINGVTEGEMRTGLRNAVEYLSTSCRYLTDDEIDEIVDIYTDYDGDIIIIGRRMIERELYVNHDEYYPTDVIDGVVYDYIENWLAGSPVDGEHTLYDLDQVDSFIDEANGVTRSCAVYEVH